jgi:hypothetical protein
MRFLRRCNEFSPAAAWWAAVAESPQPAPGIVRELLRSRSVACDPVEAEQALPWGRAHPAWIDDPAPRVTEDPNGRKGDAHAGTSPFDAPE